MAATQRELALQMVAQLRLLDPSISAEVGTPERKIIDTVAQALYENQIDLDSLSAGLDIDSKYGAQLDRFLSIFGFARQKATFATGYVVFSRTTAANVDIRIPAAATVEAPAQPLDTVNTGDVQNTNAFFQTIYDVILPAGSTSTDPVPIRATVAGSVGNVSAQRISAISGSPIYGITAVTNDTATSGGKDSESDEEFKVRFKNTVFRNLAGTQDQYMALAIATAYTTRANVIGPQSRYQEYVQIPPVADNAGYDVTGSGAVIFGNGSASEYTTMLSSVPFAKYVYGTEFPAFVSNGKTGIDQIFFRQDADFIFNSPPRPVGDTYRWGMGNLDDTAEAFYLGVVPVQPNVTFKNVYTGANGDVQAVRPNDILLLEYSYVSEVSRNDVSKGITNAVDVFIDGGNIATASTITTRPTSNTAFVDNPASKYHYENYRRVGEGEKRPLIGNVLMTLFWQPVTNVPDSIIVGTDTYIKGVHYWAIEDVSSIGGTVRARSGIEWSTRQRGKAQSDNTTDPSAYTGKIITDATGDPTGGTAIEVDGYNYDRNIVDLQAALEGAKQVTTDVLAHRVKTRYFKLDVTVMYTQGANASATNQAIRDAVDAFLKAQYFGSVIQLSDLLQVIHSVAGVDNVRWTSDIQTYTNTHHNRVFETDVTGAVIAGWRTERVQVGTSTRPEIQQLFLQGSATSGNAGLSYNGVNRATPVTSIGNDNGAWLAAYITAQFGITGFTLTEDVRSTTGVRYPIRSFTMTYTSNGSRLPITPYEPLNTLVNSPYIFENDFFLRDNELAALATDVVSGDTVPGMIIRPRAQNTWSRTK